MDSHKVLHLAEVCRQHGDSVNLLSFCNLAVCLGKINCANVIIPDSG